MGFGDFAWYKWEIGTAWGYFQETIVDHPKSVLCSVDFNGNQRHATAGQK